MNDPGSLDRGIAALTRASDLLPPDVGRHLVSLFRRYHDEHEGTDAASFVASLVDRGLLDLASALRVFARLDERVTPPSGRLAAEIRHGPRFRRLAFLARGGMGEVSFARDRDLQRSVAEKTLDRSLRDPTLAPRFLTEAQLTAQLDHPSIVPIFSLEIDESGAPSYIMKLVRGVTMQQLIDAARDRESLRNAPAFGLQARLEAFLKVCDALSHAHARRVLHRDLKPENIMIGAFGEVLVMDWGIARRIDAEDTLATDLRSHHLNESPAGLTQFGSALGTPPYMSPEQARGENSRLDQRSDLCSLGLILFELVTLTPAYPGKTTLSVLLRAQNADKEPIRHRFGDPLAPTLCAIIDKATRRDPDDRYPTVAAFAADLRRYLRDEATLALPDTAFLRLTRQVARHRAAVLGTGGALTTLTAIFLAATLVLGSAIVAVNRWNAATHEARLATAVSLVNQRGRNIESVFEADEALLRGLAAATERTLTHDAPDGERYLSEQFATDHGPPDLAMSKFYRAKVSIEHPDLTRAPGVVPEDPAIALRLRQLDLLRPHFFRALAASGGDAVTRLAPRDRAATVVDVGVPAIWAYVATEEGLLAGLPGTGDYPTGYDPRTRPWYLAAKSGDGPQWGAAYVDLNGMGLLVPCSIGLHDPDGRFIGIAAMDLSINYIIDELLDVNTLPNTEAFLIDGAGNIVVQSSLKASARSTTEHAPVRFPHDEVRSALSAGHPTGYLELASGEVALWTKLDAIGWTFVVVGDSNALG
jgi:tRNA A-37 threonylcarbamoyl transferase component Bud32